MDDLIRRADVLAYPIRIDHYDKEHGNRHFVLGIESVMEYVESLPSVELVVQTPQTYGKSINPSNAEVVADYISRADAIEAVHGACNYCDTCDLKDIGCSQINALFALPSAEAVQGWIPCSERLPDERQDVYVTVLWDDYGDYITAYGMRTRFGWHLHSNAEGELIKGYTVIAWMPLPKPYKGGEDK